MRLSAGFRRDSRRHDRNPGRMGAGSRGFDV